MSTTRSPHKTTSHLYVDCYETKLLYMYFFSYKTEFFSFQKNPKSLDLSYTMDLNLWDFFRKSKTHIIANFHRTDLVTWSHSKERKPHLIGG